MRWMGLYLVLALFTSCEREKAPSAQAPRHLLPVHAGPFEGYLQLPHALVPIWMDLRIPAQEGDLQAAYFYKRVGKDIALQGRRHGDSLELSELDAQGRIAGTFALRIDSDSLAGSWKSPGDSVPHRVKLYPADSGDKRHAIIPKAAELKLATGRTLAEEVAENSKEYDGKPSIDWDLCRKGIASVRYSWEATGAYSEMVTVEHIFDLATRKEIVVDSELAPTRAAAFFRRMADSIQKELAAYRKDYPDSEWQETLQERLDEIDGDPDSALDQCFRLDGPCNRGHTEFSLTERGLEYKFHDFFGFPHVIRAMDFGSCITIPFADLKRELHVDSPLRRLGGT